VSCDHLICARCAGPVVEGRCPTCRATRDDLHGSPLQAGSPLLLLLALVLALVLAITLHVSLQ
jgi:hypothetical protein